jgi:hypothetical protein
MCELCVPDDEGVRGGNENVEIRGRARTTR